MSSGMEDVLFSAGWGRKGLRERSPGRMGMKGLADWEKDKRPGPALPDLAFADVLFG
jgi:hypothetical protein